MTVAVTRTEAETALADQFDAVAGELPGAGWMPEIRKQAMRAFARMGLPHRRIEEWKYTDLRTGFKVAHPPARDLTKGYDEAVLLAALGRDLARLDCIRIVIVNGSVRDIAAPAGYGFGTEFHLSRLAEALGDAGADWLRPLLDADKDEDDGDAILALNTAFVTDGVVLRVVEGARLALPIHIISIADGAEPCALATRNLIRVEKGAHATILESHVSHGAAARQATAVTSVDVCEGAFAQHVKLVRANGVTTHLGRWNVSIAQDAVYRGFQLTAGGGLLRNETHVGFTGPDARLDLSGLMLGSGSDHIDTTLVVDHTTTGCESRELFKAVLGDRARAVFQGKVVVAPEAQHTDGKQMAQALMLSEDAEFDSKPELEIYADDVACGHGSTAAELDADALFYLRSRGLPLRDARAMMIESFAVEALGRIEDESVRAMAHAMALEWLGAHRS